VTPGVTSSTALRHGDPSFAVAGALGPSTRHSMSRVKPLAKGGGAAPAPVRFARGSWAQSTSLYVSWMTADLREIQFSKHEVRLKYIRVRPILRACAYVCTEPNKHMRFRDSLAAVSSCFRGGDLVFAAATILTSPDCRSSTAPCAPSPLATANLELADQWLDAVQESARLVSTR